MSPLSQLMTPWQTLCPRTLSQESCRALCIPLGRTDAFSRQFLQEGPVCPGLKQEIISEPCAINSTPVSAGRRRRASTPLTTPQRGSHVSLISFPWLMGEWHQQFICDKWQNASNEEFYSSEMAKCQQALVGLCVTKQHLHIQEMSLSCGSFRDHSHSHHDLPPHSSARKHQQGAGSSTPEGSKKCKHSLGLQHLLG